MSNQILAKLDHKLYNGLQPKSVDENSVSIT